MQHLNQNFIHGASSLMFELFRPPQMGGPNGTISGGEPTSQPTIDAHAHQAASEETKAPVQVTKVEKTIPCPANSLTWNDFDILTALKIFVVNAVAADSTGWYLCAPKQCLTLSVKAGDIGQAALWPGLPAHEPV